MTDPNAPIRNFMTPAPVSIGRHTPMAEASRRMTEHRIRHLPVLDGGRVVGIVSDRDLAMVESFPNVDTEVVPVEEAMTPDPYVVKPDAPLREVIAQLAEHKWGTAVVIENNRLAGIFTLVDAMRTFAAFLRGDSAN
ncbi:MAG: CBS domain-containing protein [Nannocystaceae bacterium]